MLVILSIDDVEARGDRIMGNLTIHVGKNLQYKIGTNLQTSTEVVTIETYDNLTIVWHLTIC